VVDEAREHLQNIPGTQTRMQPPFTWRGSRISGMAISSRSIVPPAITLRC
jgi:hypothetical protein